ncbi:MAG: HPr family phosphocarrier protein [Candidatus Eisenbacteria bacterium]
MIERTVVLANKHGLHARPAADLVRLATRFRSDVQLTKEDITVDAKSIMGVMMLAAECGSELIVTSEGPDEQEAMEAVVEFLETESE